MRQFSNIVILCNIRFTFVNWMLCIRSNLTLWNRLIDLTDSFFFLMQKKNRIGMKLNICKIFKSYWSIPNGLLKCQTGSNYINNIRYCFVQHCFLVRVQIKKNLFRFNTKVQQNSICSWFCTKPLEAVVCLRYYIYPIENLIYSGVKNHQNIIYDCIHLA